VEKKVASKNLEEKGLATLWGGKNSRVKRKNKLKKVETVI